LGSAEYDSFWLTITNKFSHIPLYIFLIYLLIQKSLKINESKKKIISLLLVRIFSIIFLILISDQLSNFFKNNFERLRPCYNLDLADQIRIVKESCGGSFGFFSAHASNSFVVATFFYLFFSSKNKFSKLLFLWASIIAYSRIYVGVHYPLDIVFGSLLGFMITFSFYRKIIIPSENIILKL
jgi:undecaprenyl-diphosphatase